MILNLLTVTVASKPSGTFATMSPMRKMTASSQVYPRIMDKMLKVPPKKKATPVMMWMKCSISMAIGVCPTSRLEARIAIRPMTVRSPVLITTPVAEPADELHITFIYKICLVLLSSCKRKFLFFLIPSTQFVERNAMFFVSKGFSLENWGVRVWGSDSPVREELSTWNGKKNVLPSQLRLYFWIFPRWLATLTLHPCAQIIRRSAGIRSPPLISTRSPTTTSSALMLFFSPSRITNACYKTTFSVFRITGVFFFVFFF